jgi:AraC family 4-hydroxyphenylacetate 3-monooxygenase operon regulatory protein
MFSPAFLPQGVSSSVLDLVKTNKYFLLQPSKEQFATIQSFTHELICEYKLNEPLKKEVLQSLLHTLLLKLQRLERADGPQTVATRRNTFMEKLEHLLEEHYRSNWKVSRFAEAMNMTTGNLSANCQKHYSMSAQQVINERVLLEVKRLLVYSDKSVKEICYELNFEDASYFNRFFKKYTGTTPLTYRNLTKIDN